MRAPRRTPAHRGPSLASLVATDEALRAAVAFEGGTVEASAVTGASEVAGEGYRGTVLRYDVRHGGGDRVAVVLTETRDGLGLDAFDAFTEAAHALYPGGTIGGPREAAARAVEVARLAATTVSVVRPVVSALTVSALLAVRPRVSERVLATLRDPDREDLVPLSLRYAVEEVLTRRFLLPEDGARYALLPVLAELGDGAPLEWVLRRRRRAPS